MKTIASVAAIILAAALNTLAQGTVNWNGPFANSVTAQTNSTQYSVLAGGGGATGMGSVGNVATGTGFYFTLLYQSFTGVQAPQPTSFAQLAAWTDTGLMGSSQTTVAGRLAVFTANVAQTVPWASGTTDSVMLVIWSQNLGSTFANALASMEDPNLFSGDGFFGETATGYINPSTSAVSGATLFNNNPQGTSGLPIGNSVNTQLYLVVTPEPGTIALAVFGALSLFVARRSKP